MMQPDRRPNGWRRGAPIWGDTLAIDGGQSGDADGRRPYSLAQSGGGDMTAFEFFFSSYGLLLGLSVAELVGGFARSA